VKQNKNSNFFFFIIILIISVGALYSNYKNFYINIDQVKLLPNVLYQSDDVKDDYFERFSVDYPNLTATAIPIKSLMGAYWIQQDSIEKGMEYLRLGNKQNPFIGLSDMILANVYQAVGELDSFTHYSRNAIRKLPNAPTHYALIGRVYVLENKIDSLATMFNSISNKVTDVEVWKVYLSAMVTNKYKVDTVEVNKNARIAKELFANNESVELLSDYVLYGEDDVNESIKLREVAIDSFFSNSRYSINKIEKALSLVPDNLSNWETLIEMYFLNDKFKEVIEIYDDLNRNGNTQLKASVIEYIIISYLNLQDLGKGCYLAELLLENNVNLSSSVLNVCRG
jgi:tetratricopeptide (TPR) repeat protein